MKEKSGRKPGKKFARQIMIIITAVFLLLTALMIAAIYYISSKVYLVAKNDMIERDLTRIRENYVIANGGFDWLLDYWSTHPDEVTKGVTKEDLELSAEYGIYGSTDDNLYEYFESLSPAAQRAVAKDYYMLLLANCRYELDSFNYGDIYLVDISKEKRGFIYLVVNGDGKEEPVIGDYWKFKVKDHPAIRNFMSGEYDDIEFETIDDKYDKGNYYVGCMPIKDFRTGEVRALLCLDYNWDSFNKDLIDITIVHSYLLLVVMLLFWLILIRIINRLATKPLFVLQNAVKDYTENRNSEKVVEQLKDITTGNEIGQLSKHFEKLAVENDKYINDLKKAEKHIDKLSDDILHALAMTIDAKDKYTNGHSTRVAIYSRMLAGRLGMTDEECNMIYRMGLLHDIGKIGIPNEIINKPGKLTDEEFDVIKSHTTQGDIILSEIKSFPELAQAARWHHERYDGKGYPDGLKGEELPFAVRIISVADSYDAMTSNRSYRNYLPQEVVEAEIKKNLGTQFDPIVAYAMLEIIKEDRFYKLHE